MLPNSSRICFLPRSADRRTRSPKRVGSSKSGASSPARRELLNSSDLPALSERVYCMMTESEWRHETFRGSAEAVTRFPDEQGQPLRLVRVRPCYPKREGTKR